VGPPRDTRRLLLNAAAQEFAFRGAHGARVHAIVKRSGVNERMIYHHFGNKEGLYRAVLADQWADMADAWRPALSQISRVDPRRGLKLAFTALFERFVERPLMIPLVIQESMTGWKHLPPASLSKVPREVRRLYARGQQDGVIRSDRPFEIFYFTILGALISLKTIAPRFSDVREKSRSDATLFAGIADQIIDIVLDGVGTHHNPMKQRRT
jgi:AcrR family transcriptional regulator